MNQIDRDRAYTSALNIYGKRVAEMIRMGQLDNHHLLIAFATHRREALEQAAQVADSHSDMSAGSDDPVIQSACDACATVADHIRALT